jgi:two-component system CheB/CheR fusion protein
MLAFLLEQSGYEVVTANSGSEALESTKQERFDVVITDIGMPDMNGYELAEALRRLPDYSTVPLVAMTGFAEYSDRRRSGDAGFNAHLNKPVDPMALLEIITRLRN